MAGLMFLTLIKLNEPAAARSWARTARVAADEAGDSTVRSWVNAHEAYVHYYAGNINEAILVARQAQELAGRAACAGVPLAAALEARAWGALGDRGKVNAALTCAWSSLAGLDADQQQPSAFGYNEAQLWFHTGNAYTQIGDTKAAADAHERALALYPEQDFLDRTLILLDSATCLVLQNEFDRAMRLATETLLALNAEQREGLVLKRGFEVWAGIPKARKELPAVKDFRDLLVSSREG